ncbi:MAG: hypothetical protein IKN16_09645 [Selenomonadaceae bacterium]|nr:hypothetical protein [Selenomonadaceae bacterium]
MISLSLKAVEDLNALPSLRELREDWGAWREEFTYLEMQFLRRKIAVLEVTIRAARKQLAEYQDKASEYSHLAWDEESEYYKNKEMNLANVCFDNAACTLANEISAMEKELRSLKRKLKKLDSKN